MGFEEVNESVYSGSVMGNIVKRKNANEEFFLMSLLSYKLKHQHIDRILHVSKAFTLKHVLGGWKKVV